MKNLQDDNLGSSTSPTSKTANDPLYMRISSKIGTMIEQCPDNSIFPSERELAKRFGVNRRTLRKALQPFADKGVLERGVRGTFVRKGTDSDWDDVHLFNAYGYNPPASFVTQRKINVCMYQNYPLQKRGWEKIVKSFNATNVDGVHVEIDWLDKSVASLEDYYQYLAQASPDIALLSLGPWNSRIIKDFAAEMPDDLVGSVYSKAFLTNSMAPDMRTDFPGFAPVLVSPPCLLWNQSFVDELGVGAELDVLKFGGSPIDVFIKNRKKVTASGVKISGHVADLMGDLGMRRDAENALRDILKNNFEKVARLPRNAEDWFTNSVTNHYYIFDSMERLRRRETMFSMGLLMYGSSLLASGGKEFTAVLPKAPENEDISVDISGFIVNSANVNKNAAWVFVEFMLSEETQALLAKLACCLPARKGSGLVELPLFAHRDTESIDAYLDSLVCSGKTRFKLGLDLAEARKNYFPALIRKTMSVNEALEAALTKRNDHR